MTMGQVRRNGVVPPEIGSWYRRLNGNLFMVVAVDEEDATIELQHFDGTIDFDFFNGTIEEVKVDGWLELSAERANEQQQ